EAQPRAQRLPRLEPAPAVAGGRRRLARATGARALRPDLPRSADAVALEAHGRRARRAARPRAPDPRRARAARAPGPADLLDELPQVPARRRGAVRARRSRRDGRDDPEGLRARREDPPLLRAPSPCVRGLRRAREADDLEAALTAARARAGPAGS